MNEEKILNKALVLMDEQGISEAYSYPSLVIKDLLQFYYYQRKSLILFTT